MNAKMRIGHFTRMQPSRPRVKMADLKTVILSGFFAVMATQSLAAGLPRYDTNLEIWAKQRLAQRIGDMRDSYNADENLRMVTELDVKHGPLPLSAERHKDPIWLITTLRFGPEINLYTPPPPPAPIVETVSNDAPYPGRRGYEGAVLLAGN